MSVPEVLVPFPSGMVRAAFTAREKRFTVHAKLGGAPVRVHTNNTGTMLGLLRPGRELLLSPAANPARKLPYTLEAVAFGGGLVSVNTSRPPQVLAAAWKAGRIPELAGATACRLEVTTGDSRLDAAFDTAEGTCFVETKNVTLAEDGAALFPDAATTRGCKHLEELMRLAAQGARCATFYLVSRADCACFGPADLIDAAYARLFYEALARGVAAWPYRALMSEAGIGLGEMLPIRPQGC